MKAGLSCEACILAGGLSTRMGRDKSRLPLAGKSLLTHVRAVTRAARLSTRVIRRDLVPRCGPLGGIFTALQTTLQDAIIFLSCDMPFVTPDLLLDLRRCLTSETDAVFFAAETPGFPCIIRASARPGVAKQIQKRQLALHQLGAILRTVYLRAGQPGSWVAFNVNTPQDLQAARCAPILRDAPRRSARPGRSSVR